MTKRMKYNLQQAFNKLKKEYDEEIEYKVISEDMRKVAIKFLFKGKERNTIFFKSELRSINITYNVILNIL